ncbi:MAG: DUF2569 family protein [Desulfobaccales bacterium]
MCIFCGGQCGIAEFLISIGLPFLGLYFYRIRNSLIKITNRIFRRNSAGKEIPDQTIKCSPGGELLQDCRKVSTRAIELEHLELIEVKSQHREPADNLTGIIKFTKPSKSEKREAPKGVRGWLLLLCINLTIIIPALCLYNVISIYYFINSPLNQLIILISKNLSIYHMVIVAIMVFSATLSFCSGLQLWDVKPAAIKFTKIFLIIQLFLSFVIAIIQSLMPFPFGSGDNNYVIIVKTIIPSLIYFSLWYAYLSKSSRVHNTYSEVFKNRVIIRHVPVELKGYTEVT